jgi:hypothetical protein
MAKGIRTREESPDMADTLSTLSHNDLLFMVETLIPERTDKERLVELIKDDESFVEAMLRDKELFDRMMGDEEILVKISPKLFFTVLLERIRRDLEKETYTVEKRNLQRIAVFDSDRVVDLLSREQIRDYLAEMLASFTRVESFTLPVRVRKGIWRKYRFNDFNVDSLIRYCQAINEEHRFRFYKRIADVCLFLAGMFPEHIEAQSRYPLSGKTRPRVTGQNRRNIEDYEEEGRAFYERAAEHEVARAQNLDGVLSTLSENFTLAKKPLAFMSDHYLWFRKHEFFDMR